MASDIGTAYVNIVPKAEGIKGKVAGMVEGAAGPAGTAGGKLLGLKMAAAVGAAAIGAAVVTGVKKSLEEGAALQQSMGGIETLFKGSADTVIKNARQAFKTVGVSANEYMENVTSFSAGLIKSLDGDTKKAAQTADMAMIDMSDNANKMGSDIASIQNAYQGFAKQNYTMLDNLKLGYGGTKEEMQRLLDDASKLSGQKYDMSNLNDVYEAIHVVQEELGITGTTAKEASETLSGSFNSMKSAFTDLMGNLAIGENVEESMQNLIETTGTFLIDNLIPMVVQIFKSLPAAINGAVQAGMSDFDLSAFNDMFSKGVDEVVNNLPQMFEQFGQKVNEMAPIIAEEGAFIAMKLGEGLLKAAPVMMSATGELINAMLKVLVGVPAILIAKGLGAVGMFALGILKGINKVATAAGNMVSSVVNKIKTLPSVLAGWASRATNSFGDKIRSGVKNAVNKVKNFFPLSIGKIFSNFKLPHVSVSGGKAPFGIGGAGSLPKFNVKWYAKGGILTEPTLFGGGEKGSEAILPLDPFWRELDNRGSIDYDRLSAVLIDALLKASLTVETVVDGKVIARSTAPYMRKELDNVDRRASRSLGIVGV